MKGGIEKTRIVHAFIVGDWHTITLKVKEKMTIEVLKALVKAEKDLNCSIDQMRVYYYGNPDLHVGKLSFIHKFA